MIHSLKYFSSEVVLYLIKFTIWFCMEDCCHVWFGIPNWYFDLLDKLHSQVFRSFGSILEILVINEINLFFRYFLKSFLSCPLNWLICLCFLVLIGSSLVIVFDCMIFLPSFVDVARMCISTFSFVA